MNEWNERSAASTADDPSALRAVAERVVTEAVEHLHGLPRPWERRDGDGSVPGLAGPGLDGAGLDGPGLDGRGIGVGNGDGAGPRGPLPGVSTKSSPTDVVTAADTALEALVRTRLAQLRPGEPVVGEEGGGTVGSGVTWVVDPIDGTVNFLYGLPWYAVSLAATRDGVTIAGAVAEPASGRLWSAARGQGATCDGRPLLATPVTDLDLTMVGTGFSYRAERRARQAALVAGLLPRVRDVRRSGSSALDVCAVAAGWLDAYVEHGTNWWDWAASSLIAQEAGAVVRTPAVAGRAVPDDGLGADALLVAAPGVAADLAALLRELGGAKV